METHFILRISGKAVIMKFREIYDLAVSLGKKYDPRGNGVIPEYQMARRLKAGPRILVGDKKRQAGQIFVKMTGGTGGSEKAYEKLAQAGVGTVIAMHMTEKHRQAAKDSHINVIVSGHMASDSLGMNLFLDQLRNQGIEILPCAELLRVERQ